jgi:hypothetical protein
VLQRGRRMNIFFPGIDRPSPLLAPGHPRRRFATQQFILRFQNRLSMEIDTVIESFE